MNKDEEALKRVWCLRCGYSGGRSGETCPSCGGMLLSGAAQLEAERLARVWESEEKQGDASLV